MHPKYLKRKKRVYACFIDYRKAFDTVCREALLFKLHELGISGRFFDCMEYMYKNSKARIKLINKISDTIDILIGTEQGHPMSPELFKCYLLELSSDLDSPADLNVPEINGKKVSHLLWADDLVLLALDVPSLQKLIDIAKDYCARWGLTVNISKTAIMVFNKSGRLLNESNNFKIGNTVIQSVKEYCYLGITFSLSGSFTKTQDELKKKGLRAYFSLKKLIDLKALSIKSLFKLFDALIVPVIGYGCQVWLSSTKLLKLIANGKQLKDTKNSLIKIASDPLERIHIKFLKWSFSVHAKASNLACWGDSGRVPLVIQLLKQTSDYFKRLEHLDNSDVDCLARHAFAEQRENMLPWYSNTLNFIENIGLTTASPSLTIRDKTTQIFNDIWWMTARNSSKLKFYTKIKTSIGYEPYLSLKDIRKRRAIARLRFSCHRLNIETARYSYASLSTNQDSIIWNKCCNICSDDNVELLISLPFAEPILEDEEHALVTCPMYQHIRYMLDDTTKSALISRDEERLKDLFNVEHIYTFSTYVMKIFQLRFPKTAS